MCFRFLQVAFAYWRGGGESCRTTITPMSTASRSIPGWRSAGGSSLMSAALIFGLLLP